MPYLDLNLMTLLEGDCRERLKVVPDESVDLYLTSPPYADQRDEHYEGIPAAQYVEWFRPIAREIKRTLKPHGSFLLNMKSHCHDGRRLRYDQHTVDMCIEEGLVYTDEYIWYKSKRPGRKTRRLADAWEPVFHLTKTKESFINHPAIAIYSKWTMVNQTAFISNNPRTGNKGGYTDIAEHGEGMTDPDNILRHEAQYNVQEMIEFFAERYLANGEVPDNYLNFPVSYLTLDGKYKHPAKFPFELASFLIRAFCPPGGTVADPFCGSGITAAAALALGNRCVGCELEPRFQDMIWQRLREYLPPAQRNKPAVSEQEMLFADPKEDTKPEQGLAKPLSDAEYEVLSSFDADEE